MLMLGAQSQQETEWQIPVIPTCSLDGQGISELLSTIDKHLVTLKTSGKFNQRRLNIARTRLLKAAENILREKFEYHSEGKINDLTNQIISGNLHPNAAAKILLS